MNKVKAYLLDSFEELRTKTTWPTWTEMQRTAVVVAVSTLIIALVIMLMDKSITTVLEFIYNLFS
jgi:preprotein translocase subunit SecE